MEKPDKILMIIMQSVAFSNTVVLISMQLSNNFVQEGSPPLDVCAVILDVPSGGLGINIVVQFSINDISQFVSTADYSVTDLTAVFLSNETTNNDTTCISINITDDNILESNEMITVEISNTIPALQVLMNTTTVTILDNDSELFSAL